MPYVDSFRMLNSAIIGSYAVGAFNVENTEMVRAVIHAAEHMNSPVILQTTESTLKYMDAQLFYVNVFSIAKNSNVPVALHLDHGKSIKAIQKALDASYSSVMIDGSMLSLEENILLTSTAVKIASVRGIPVEGELGGVGGKEDDVIGCDNYTNIDEALRFVTETKISSLAVGIGTAHGIYKTTPILDTDRLEQIRKKLTDNNIQVPIVLHGASGLADEAVWKCIKKGVCKVNFATELRQAFTGGIKQYIEKDKEVIDPKKYLSAAMENVFDLVCKKIEICGSKGMAKNQYTTT